MRTVQPPNTAVNGFAPRPELTWRLALNRSENAVWVAEPAIDGSETGGRAWRRPGRNGPFREQLAWHRSLRDPVIRPPDRIVQVRGDRYDYVFDAGHVPAERFGAAFDLARPRPRGARTK